MAREADACHDDVQITPFLERFAEIIRAEAIAEEREACAKVCDVLAVHPEYASEVTKLAASAIRARTSS